MKCFIIGITGVSGAGKTTLAINLSKELKATCLFWDDFDEISKSPDDYVEWFHAGSNYNEFNYESLANVLIELKKGKVVIHPVFKQKLNPTNYIIFDAPNGRLHPQTGKYIDYCIHIDTPLDVSLIRRTIRDFKDPTKTKEDILEDLSFYLNHSRPLFFDEDLKIASDFNIDGCLSIEAQIKKIRINLRI